MALQNKKEKPESPHYYICLFKIDGNSNFRLAQGKDTDTIHKQLTEQLGDHKVITKRYYEIDRNTGNIEEF